MAPGNQDKTRTAPVTAIIGMDMAFYGKLPQLFPLADARSWCAGNQAAIDTTAFRNSSLRCLPDAGCTCSGTRMWANVWF